MTVPAALAFAWITATAVLAQTSQALSIETWIQWGILGVILVLILLGHLVPGWVVKEKNEAIDSLLAENRELRNRFEDVIPLLARAVETLGQTADERS